MITLGDRLRVAWKPMAVCAAIVFMYSSVLWKLGYDWWSDDNYSHGLVVPIVIAYIVWHDLPGLRRSVGPPRDISGLSLIGIAAFLLLSGSLASVLFAQRISLVLMMTGLVLLFFGWSTLRRLGTPFLLFLLSIPIPQLVFNKIAFPLQLLASKIAVFCIGGMGIPAERYGNVIGIVHASSGEVVNLEVVEACSGIRSLTTLITLALILGYFTRDDSAPSVDGGGRLGGRDLKRTAALMAAAVPVALLTNAARVVVSGILARSYGQSSLDGLWHDISGGLVFAAALSLLVGLNELLKRFFRRVGAGQTRLFSHRAAAYPLIAIGASNRRVVLVMVLVLLCGFFVNWFEGRGEAIVDRRPLQELPVFLGPWEKRNDDIKFDEESERVLRAHDYVMRDYYGPGKRLNVYVGFYASQRNGATYHSPLSCLPGTGWELSEPELINVSTPSGRELQVNRYIVSQGHHKEFLIYWFQGRGRVNTNEYIDKFYTSLDSVTRRRSDGGMVRVMTPLGKDPQHSLAAAIDLTGHLADNLSAFLPE